MYIISSIPWHKPRKRYLRSTCLEGEHSLYPDTHQVLFLCLSVCPEISWIKHQVSYVVKMFFHPKSRRPWKAWLMKTVLISTPVLHFKFCFIQIKNFWLSLWSCCLINHWHTVSILQNPKQSDRHSWMSEWSLTFDSLLLIFDSDWHWLDQNECDK